MGKDLVDSVLSGMQPQRQQMQADRGHGPLAVWQAFWQAAAEGACCEVHWWLLCCLVSSVRNSGCMADCPGDPSVSWHAVPEVAGACLRLCCPCGPTFFRDTHVPYCQQFQRLQVWGPFGESLFTA